MKQFLKLGFNQLTCWECKTNFLKDHIFVILIFILLTGIFTFPGYLEFDKLLGVYGDAINSLNTFWWYNHSINNQSNPFDFHWIFYNNYQFFPIGVPLNESGTLSAILSIPLYHIFGNLIIVYNVLLCSSFILTAYGTFLVARHVVQNYFASIMAGIIFSFGIYRMWHSVAGHLDLVTTQFIPFFILFLLMTLKTNRLKNPVAGGIFLFLTLVSSIYIAFYTVLFLLLFLIYVFYKKEKKSVFLKIVLMFSVALSLSIPFYFGIYLYNHDNYLLHGRSLIGFTAFGTDITNFVLPNSLQSIVKIVNSSFWSDHGGGETSAFIGYTVLALIIIAIIKSKLDKKLLWILTAVFFAVLSMGPTLKIFGINTGIPLLYNFLYDKPIFDLFRATGRSDIFVAFSISILAAYGLNEIFKIKYSQKKKILLVCFIISIIIIEYIAIPFPITDLSVSQPYYQIASDPVNYAILESPMGGPTNSIEDVGFGSLINYQFYQTVHQKPIYSGGSAPGVPEKTQRYIQTYFLNQFIWNQPSQDIVNQNLQQVGISLFNYYDIGYVIAHKHFYNEDQYNVTNIWIPQTRLLLHNIFSKSPDYEDGELFMYKIPKSNSTIPFIVLGDGWNPLTDNFRIAEQNTTIKIINPSKVISKTNITLKLGSLINNHLILNFNGKTIANFTINEKFAYNILLNNLELQPGSNQITLFSEGKIDQKISGFVGNKYSVAVKEISIQTNPSIGSFQFYVNTSQDNYFIQKLWVEYKINLIYHKILNVDADEHGMEYFTNLVLTQNKDFNFVQTQLENYKSNQLIRQ